MRLVGSDLLNKPPQVSIATLDYGPVRQVWPLVPGVQLSLLVRLTSVLDEKFMAILQTKIDRDAFAGLPLEHGLVGAHADRLVDRCENQTVRFVLERI